jgi:hypothetical protein
MKRRSLRALSGIALAATALACITPGCAGSSSRTTQREAADEYVEPAELATASRTDIALASVASYPSKRLCDAPTQPGTAACHARVRVDSSGKPKYYATPSGFTPKSLQAAYNLTALAGAKPGTKVGIIDAQDDPNAESDLGVYRAEFGLPPCTTANGCFKKVNQSGDASPLPAPDTSWAGEISLDIDMVSALCPNCNILLVETNSASNDDLGEGINTAVTLGATVVSNSYGGNEDGSDASLDAKYYTHPGVAMFAASGDSSFAGGTLYPASSPNVIAVGGTSLVAAPSTPRGFTESAWFGGGSGCSAYSEKPSWQKDTGCAKKTVADVAAVADPDTGVAVYDTFGGATAGKTGWSVYGGTSAASPIVASIFARTGQGAATGELPYANTGAFYDVTTGINGGQCTPEYLCTAGPGYDGPTGVGTPNGAALLAIGASGDDGGTDAGTAEDGGADAGSGVGEGTCRHSLCATGKKLTERCSPCSKEICKVDRYCCDVKWDSICVGEVQSICQDNCR